MSARRLRAATDAAQGEWIERLGALIGNYAPAIAEMSTEQAQAAVATLLRRETVLARGMGEDHMRNILSAAGVPPGTRSIGVHTSILPSGIGRRIALDWEESKESRDFREGRLRRALDQALDHAHDMGMLAQIESHPEIVGYRRVAHPGACGACMAHADGRVLHGPDPVARHPFCRCAIEPVVRGINESSSGRLGPAQRWAAMSTAEQDELLGADKAMLLREGHIGFGDLIAAHPRRRGQPPVIEEASLGYLRLVATERRLIDRGLIDAPINLPDGLAPAERTQALKAALQDAAESTWERPSITSWALDPRFGYIVSVPDRIFDKVARSHPDLMDALGITARVTPSPASLAALRSTALRAVGRATISAAGNRPTRREHYLERGIEISPGRPRWLVAIVEFQGIEGEAFNLYASRKPPKRVMGNS